MSSVKFHVTLTWLCIGKIHFDLIATALKNIFCLLLCFLVKLCPLLFLQHTYRQLLIFNQTDLLGKLTFLFQYLKTQKLNGIFLSCHFLGNRGLQQNEDRDYHFVKDMVINYQGTKCYLAMSLFSSSVPYYMNLGRHLISYIEERRRKGPGQIVPSTLMRAVSSQPLAEKRDNPWEF